MSVHHRAQAVRKLRMCWLAELRLCVETGTCLFKYRPISARNSFVHLTVGAFKCIVVNDGTLSYTTPARFHFPNAPSDQLAVALRKDEQARVFAFHFNFPGLGTVRKSQGAWQWQPMVLL